MTTEEFNATAWTAGMTARYSDGKIYPIAACDFGEQLVGLKDVVQNAPEEIYWARCENITIQLA